MSVKIIAVVVTYNRLTLLKECIDGIRRQSYKVDKIIVVNNGSTDGTELWLKNQIDLFVFHQGNLGGAGGFEKGVKEAFKLGGDWFWLMDDDVEAKIDCLENQIKYKGVSECIQPVRQYLDEEITLWEQYWDLKNDHRIQLDNISFSKNKTHCFVNVGCFEGMLISRNIVEKIGYPDPRFFIANDDTIYGYLASLYTNILYTKDAVLIRKKMSYEEVLSKSFLYYSTRNKHLIIEYINKIFPNTNIRHLERKYLYQEIKLFFFLLISGNFSFKNKVTLIKALIKGKNDYFKKKIGM